MTSEDIEKMSLKATSKRWFKYQLMQMELEKTRLENLLQKEIRENTKLYSKLKALEFENEELKEKMKND